MNIKKSITLEKLLRKYKPLDEKLRGINTYRKISNLLHRKYLASREDKIRIEEQRPYAEFRDQLPLQNVVLFECYSGRKISCNPLAMYRELRKSPLTANIPCIWVITSKTYIPDDVKSDPAVSFVYYRSTEYVEALSTSKYLVNNWIFPGYFSRKNGQHYVNVWHGVPIKTLGLDIEYMGFEKGPPLQNSGFVQTDLLQATSLPLASEYTIEKIASAYALPKELVAKAIVTGSPRLDTSAQADKRSLKQELDIPLNKKTILFAPTWRGAFGSVDANINTTLSAIEEIHKNFENEFFIILSIHHSIKSKIKTLKMNDSCLIINNENINEILAVTDVLISDYSSIAIDAIALDIPTLLYIHDMEDYERFHGLYFNLEELPVILARDLQSLIESISHARKPSLYCSYQSAKLKYFPQEDGSAAKRSLVALFNDQNKIPTKRKKSILIYPGALLANGITSSFLNLVRNIDYEKYEVSILLDAAFTYLDGHRMNFFHQIDNRCNIVLKAGAISYTKEERDLINKFFQSPNSLTTDQEKVIHTAYKRESIRVIGHRHFDVAIDFSGYSPYWSLLISQTSADHKVIYQHSDMHAELTNANKRHSRLEVIIKIYDYFDAICSVSKEIMEINKSMVGQEHNAHKHTYARNSINIQHILKQSNTPLSLIQPYLSVMLDTKNITKYCCVGRLSPEKGHKRLLEAFKIFLDEGNAGVLFIVGDGPLRKTLELMAKRLRITEYVKFLGQLNNPYPLIKSCDCLVFPSDYEGQGLVLIEALTLKTPCVGSNIPAVKGILGTGNGFLVEKTPDALARALRQIANQPALTVNFDVQAYTNQAMQDFYKNVCKS